MGGWVASFAVCCVLGQTPTPSQPDLEQQVRLAVETLASPRYDARQVATEQLWKLGTPAIPELRRAATHKNREIRERAKYVLQNLEQGIAYDTPRDILAEVQRFRIGDVDDRRFALRTLETAHQPRIILGLLRTERDERLRVEWLEILEAAVQKTLLHGDLAEVETALRDAATDDVWIRHWVTYLATRGQLDAEFEREHQQVGDSAESCRWRLLSYLSRARGDLTEARRFAAQAEAAAQAAAKVPLQVTGKGEQAIARVMPAEEPADLEWQLLLEAQDWAGAAARLQAKIGQDPAAVNRDPEILGFAAAYHRLAGGEPQFQDTCRQLVRTADDAEATLKNLDPRRGDVEKDLIERQWFAGKALLLNGQQTLAIPILRRHHSAFAFEYLAHQQRYREAFEIAGVPYPDGFKREWFGEVVKATAAADDEGRQKFAIAMHALRQLYFLGYRSDAVAWLKEVAEGTAKDTGTVRRRMLLDTAVKLGQRELAIQLAALTLEREGSPAALSLLYSGRAEMATVWWEFFREKYGRETLAQSLARIDRCLLVGSRWEIDELRRIAQEFDAHVPQLVEPKRAEWWHALAETALLYGERDSAVKWWEKAAAFSSVDTLRLGDWYSEQKDWSRAADWYRRTLDFDALKPLPRFLYGQSLLKAGKVDEGQRMIDVALWLPLGNAESRRELAMGMKERGYRAESLLQFEWIMRTAEPGEQDVVEAHKQIGNSVYQQEPLRGADSWRRMVHCCLRSKWGFVDANGYVQIPFLVHKTRAIGLARAGQGAAASEEARRGLDVSPLNIELAEELIPELQKVGQGEAADQLFQASVTPLRQLVRDFSGCATLHNNLAWICARSSRDLDEALQHVQEALRLEPKSSAYLDTLAEVQFRRGAIAAAVEAAEECVRLDSRNQHYQEQLARFRAAVKP